MQRFFSSGFSGLLLILSIGNLIIFSKIKKFSAILTFLITLFLVNQPDILYAQKIGDYLQYGRMELEKENYTEAIKYLNNAIRHRPASFEGYFLRGIAKYSLDDYLGAEQDFTEAAKYDLYNPEIYHYRAISRSEQYDFGGAFADYTTAIEIDPNNPYYYLNRARSYLIIHEYDSVVKDCNKAISLKYKRENVYLMRGVANAGLEFFDEAIDDIDVAILKDPENTYSYIQRGTILMEINEPDSAIQDFNKALAIRKDDPHALFSRAMANMETSDTTAAFDDLNKVIEISPYNSYAYYNRAILKINLGKDDEAIEDLNKVLAFNPENIVIYLYRGRLKQSIGDLRGALADFNKAIEIYPDFADAYYERSQVKRQMQDYYGAEEDQKMAYSINRFNFSDNDSLKLAEEMYLKRIITFSGEFYAKGNDIKLQDQVIQIELKPIFTTVLFSRNMESIKMYDTFEKEVYPSSVITLSCKEDLMDANLAQEQINSFNDEIKKEPENPDHYFNRGQVYSHLQNFNKALQDYSDAITLDNEYILAYFNRANLKYKITEIMHEDNQNQFQLSDDVDVFGSQNSYDTTFLKQSYKEVLQDYNKVIELDPDFYYAYFNRSFIKSMMGDYWGAVSDLTRALEIEPAFAEAFFNKGLTLIFLNLKNVGCEDISRAGELGVQDSYHVMKRYCFK